jgi:hypothetical protein
MPPTDACRLNNSVGCGLAIIMRCFFHKDSTWTGGWPARGGQIVSQKKIGDAPLMPSQNRDLLIVSQFQSSS